MRWRLHLQHSSALDVLDLRAVGRQDCEADERLHSGGIACHLWLQYQWAKIQSESLYTKHLRKLGDVSPRQQQEGVNLKSGWEDAFTDT